MKTLIILLLFSLKSFALCGTTFDPKRIDELDKTKVTFGGLKASATVLPLTTQNIDLAIADDHLLTGASLILTNNCPDDEIKFQVLMGTTVASQFIDWYSKDLDKEIPYPAKMFCGLTLRAIYKNTCSAASVKVRINYNLHKIIL